MKFFHVRSTSEWKPVWGLWVSAETHGMAILTVWSSSKSNQASTTCAGTRHATCTFGFRVCELGTYKTVKARYRPLLSGKSPPDVVSRSLFARKRRGNLFGGLGLVLRRTVWPYCPYGHRRKPSRSRLLASGRDTPPARKVLGFERGRGKRAISGGQD